MPGFRFIEVPADADGPALEGAMWYPCSEPPGQIDLGKITAIFKITVLGAKNCPVSGDSLPLAVFFTADSLAAVRVPVQLRASQYGGDGMSPESVAAVDRNLPARHEYHVVPNAGHFGFLIPCSPALAKGVPEICTDAPSFDRAAFHKRFNADVLRCFQTHLM
jgi:pimeloyl-ACP methyl ester carboxylesterase